MQFQPATQTHISIKYPPQCSLRYSTSLFRSVCVSKLCPCDILYATSFAFHEFDWNAHASDPVNDARSNATLMYQRYSQFMVIFYLIWRSPDLM